MSFSQSLSTRKDNISHMFLFILSFFEHMGLSARYHFLNVCSFYPSFAPDLLLKFHAITYCNVRHTLNIYKPIYPNGKPILLATIITLISSVVTSIMTGMPSRLVSVAELITFIKVSTASQRDYIVRIPRPLQSSAKCFFMFRSLVQTHPIWLMK